jgi:hypothetical protein
VERRRLVSYAYNIKGSSADTTNSAWTASIGTPIGAKVAVGVGYRRTYTGGTVLVNPSPSASQTFTVNGASYTLAPTTAKIIEQFEGETTLGPLKSLAQLRAEDEEIKERAQREREKPTSSIVVPRWARL